MFQEPAYFGVNYAMQLLATFAAVCLMAGPNVKITTQTPGTGEPAKTGTAITLHYTGKLKNGKVFDTSKGKDGAPFTVVLGAKKVIPGFEMGLKDAKVGMKRKVEIPPELGYGKNALPEIPANSTLIFEIEVLKLEQITIEVLKEGTGEPVKNGDRLQVHYTGMFEDGKKFDSSYDRQSPLDVTLGGGLIEGFTQGLQGMKLGEKRKVTIPSSLGYGARGVGPIPGNATLVFEMEIVKIN